MPLDDFVHGQDGPTKDHKSRPRIRPNRTQSEANNEGLYMKGAGGPRKKKTQNANHGLSDPDSQHSLVQDEKAVQLIHSTAAGQRDRYDTDTSTIGDNTTNLSLDLTNEDDENHGADDGPAWSGTAGLYEDEGQKSLSEHLAQEPLRVLHNAEWGVQGHDQESYQSTTGQTDPERNVQLGDRQQNVQSDVSRGQDRLSPGMLPQRLRKVHVKAPAEAAAANAATPQIRGLNPAFRGVNISSHDQTSAPQPSLGSVPPQKVQLGYQPLLQQPQAARGGLHQDQQQAWVPNQASFWQSHQHLRAHDQGFPGAKAYQPLNNGLLDVGPPVQPGHTPRKTPVPVSIQPPRITDFGNKTFEDLQTEPFDEELVPAEASHQPKSTEEIHEAMSDALNSKAEAQKALLLAMSIDEWEEAGDWFVDRFGDILSRIKQARREKRQILANFEQEIAGRHDTVVSKKRATETAMQQMRAQGMNVLGATPKKTRSRQ